MEMQLLEPQRGTALSASLCTVKHQQKKFHQGSSAEKRPLHLASLDLPTVATKARYPSNGEHGRLNNPYRCHSSKQEASLPGP